MQEEKSKRRGIKTRPKSFSDFYSEVLGIGEKNRRKVL